MAVVTELARGARLMGLDILPRAPVENGAKGEVPLEVSAVGSYAEVERFFRLTALSPRLIDVEHISLTAVPDGPVKVTALLRIPFRPLKAPLPGAPEGFRPRDPTIPKPQADAYARDRCWRWRSRDHRARCGAGRTRALPLEVAAATRDRPAIVTSVAGLGVLGCAPGPGRGPAEGLE